MRKIAWWHTVAFFVCLSMASPGFATSWAQLKSFLEQENYIGKIEAMSGFSRFESIFTNQTWSTDGVVQFFHLGRTLNQQEFNQVFKGAPQGLKEFLFKQELIVKEYLDDKIDYRFNKSLSAFKLKQNQAVYLLTDFPTWLDANSPAVQDLSRTSLIALAGIQTLAGDTVDTCLKKFGQQVADFGTGTGILGLAIALMCPQTQVVGLDIDERLMTLAKLNAELNGVSSRFSVLDNTNPKVLGQHLNGKKLSSAVSNPPFNVVPSVLSQHFTKFGDGGPDGLDVMKIFISQVKQHLDLKGFFFLYAQLARRLEGEHYKDEDENEEEIAQAAPGPADSGYLLQDYIFDQHTELSLSLWPLPLTQEQVSNMGQYFQGLLDFLQDQQDLELTEEQIDSAKQELKAIAELHPAYVCIGFKANQPQCCDSLFPGTSLTFLRLTFLKDGQGLLLNGLMNPKGGVYQTLIEH